MTPHDRDLRLIADSPLFDGAWYGARYPDVALSGLSPPEHFLRVGARLGRDPGPRFSTARYLERHADVAGAGRNPLAHFEEAQAPWPEAPAPPAGGKWVDVVVPVHNALEAVQACLRSLARAPNALRARVLIVDDGSDAPTAAWLARAAALLSSEAVSFELMGLPATMGYTAAVNAGLRASRAPLVVLLNSDTVVTPSWLDGLVRCLRSDPCIGITGPLSNAGGWQSVPEVLAKDGGFAVNALPPGLSPDGMAALVREASVRLYPRIPFLNGFCLMIRREVIERVGLMDEAAFPIGYGEENDYAIRARDAGFALVVADDVFVFHAKSQSFGVRRRILLAKAGSRALRAKHGARTVRTLRAEAKSSPVLEAVRARMAAGLAGLQAPSGRRPRDWAFSQRILFLLPDPGEGEHPVPREAAAMRWMGVEAKVAVGQRDLDRTRKAHAGVPRVRELFVGFIPTDLAMLAGRFDVVVATSLDSEALLARIVECCPWVLPVRRAGTRGLDLAAPSRSDPDVACESLAAPAEAAQTSVGRRGGGVAQEGWAGGHEACQPGAARRAMGELMLLAPALAKLREGSP